ncbi:hypothetical protein HPB47_009827 [Ixodes persulcatus]|uniref:Uncharacterized protein n=1 Tax=Ixodes persulcatus TaxID=34615 RepID=A0AC60P0U3_IXOPE|nr:hypothetical protein HPB47_009827 [Ixodes persulcatus]
MRRQYQGKNGVEVVNLTAAATGISVSSVYEIKRGFKRANGAVKSPSKKRPKFAEKRKRISNHDACTLTAVRSCLHNFFRRGEIPTLKKIAARLQEDDVLPSCSGTTLYRLRKDMGFEKQKRNRNSFLIEREDIVEWRRRYLRAVGKHRAQNRKIYFQDETWERRKLMTCVLYFAKAVLAYDLAWVVYDSLSVNRFDMDATTKCRTRLHTVLSMYHPSET